MKAIDAQGKLFGRINILDFIAILVVLFFAFVLFLNLSKQSLSSLGTIEEATEGTLVFSVVMEPGYYEAIEPGMQLAEDKRFLDMFVTVVEEKPVMVATVADDGTITQQIDPTRSELIVTVEGKFTKKGASYKLGKQEIRQGIKAFLTGEFFDYQAIIVGLEVKQ